jgi:hypothetical protein
MKILQNRKKPHLHRRMRREEGRQMGISNCSFFLINPIVRIVY